MISYVGDSKSFWHFVLPAILSKNVVTPQQTNSGAHPVGTGGKAEGT
jgi:hypothetical protein